VRNRFQIPTIDDARADRSAARSVSARQYGERRLFHPRFVGLTGDMAAIEEAAGAYRVYYRTVERDDKADYTVDHSAFIYLMDRDGKYLGFFPPGTSAERMAETIRPLLVSPSR
jgi:protein SCO1/2